MSKRFIGVDLDDQGITSTPDQKVVISCWDVDDNGDQSVLTKYEISFAKDGSLQTHKVV